MTVSQEVRSFSLDIRMEKVFEVIFNLKNIVKVLFFLFSLDLHRLYYFLGRLLQWALHFANSIGLFVKIQPPIALNILTAVFALSFKKSFVIIVCSKLCTEYSYTCLVQCALEDVNVK